MRPPFASPSEHDLAGSAGDAGSRRSVRQGSAPGMRTLMVASIRYLDQFVKQGGQWLFGERRLMVSWTDTRPTTL